jgi:transcriptional regulator
VQYREEVARARGRRDRRINRAITQTRATLARLEAERDAEIARMRQEGVSGAEIARAVGVSEAMVSLLTGGPGRREEWRQRDRDRRHLRAVA